MTERYRLAGSIASPLFFGAIYMSGTGHFWNAGLPVLIIGLFLYFSPEIFDRVSRRRNHDD